jgi:hypothetical protein
MTINLISTSIADKWIFDFAFFIDTNMSSRFLIYALWYFHNIDYKNYYKIIL